jgi:5-methylcytosine-specific restriction protein A
MMANKIARPCWYPLCKRINCTIHGERPKAIRPPDTRPSAALRGYGSRWREKRNAFLKKHPFCEDCGAPSRIADHMPSRRELVRLGVADPDADQYLHPRCQTCHNRKTNKQEGGGWHGRGD